MHLKLISDCDYDIEFKISCCPNRTIKLRSGQSMLLNICDDFNNITIMPLLIKYDYSLLEKILKTVSIFLYFLFYYFLIPFIDKDSSIDFSDLILIDKIDIDIYSIKKSVLEVKYYYRNNSLFSTRKIQCMAEFETNNSLALPAVDAQIKKISGEYILQHIFVFIPLILLLIISSIYSIIKGIISVSIISSTVLLFFLILLFFIYLKCKITLKKAKTGLKIDGVTQGDE